MKFIASEKIGFSQSGLFFFVQLLPCQFLWSLSPLYSFDNQFFQLNICIASGGNRIFSENCPTLVAKVSAKKMINFVCLRVISKGG